MLSSFDRWLTTEPADDPRCPVCADPPDFCRGHGPIGDPVGARILDQHDAGDHHDCDPRGCEEAFL
jgi:hypothetical protein